MIWLFLIVMILGALAIILLPLLRTLKLQADERGAQNISIAKEQLNKLSLELSQGRITQEEYQLAQDDLQKSLHADLAHQSSQAMTSKEPEYKTSIAVAVSVIMIATALYYSLGNPKVAAKQTASNTPPMMKTTSVDSQPTNNTMASGTSGQVSDVQTLFAKLKQRLANNPDDGEGWKMMGLSYIYFEQFDEAIDAYTKAVALLPDDNDAVAGLNRAKQAKLGSAFSATPPTTNIIEKTMISPKGQSVDVGAMVMRLRDKLEKNPNNPQGWMMLGRSYSTLGLHSESVIAYQHALELMPNSSQVKDALNNAKQAVNNSQK